MINKKDLDKNSKNNSEKEFKYVHYRNEMYDICQKVQGEVINKLLKIMWDLELWNFEIKGMKKWSNVIETIAMKARKDQMNKIMPTKSSTVNFRKRHMCYIELYIVCFVAKKLKERAKRDGGPAKDGRKKDRKKHALKRCSKKSSQRVSRNECVEKNKT